MIDTLPGLDIPEPKVPKFTERDMLDALARRYTQISQVLNDRWVRAEHVRNGTGFYGYDPVTGRCAAPLRTADFFAIDTWESKGQRIHGHEVKVSRSDWLHELADPSKAEAFKQYVHHWWLVVPDASIVRGDELPTGWGMLTLRGGRLHAVRRAPLLEPTPMPKPIWISLVRAASKTAWKVAS
jgi:hypothetical protein